MEVVQRSVGVPEGTAESSDRDLLGVLACVHHECVLTGLSDHESEDVAQDVILWFLRNRARLGQPSTPWLKAVTRNFIRRHWRAERIRRMRECHAATDKATFPDDS